MGTHRKTFSEFRKLLTAKCTTKKSHSKTLFLKWFEGFTLEWLGNYIVSVGTGLLLLIGRRICVGFEPE